VSDKINDDPHAAAEVRELADQVRRLKGDRGC
jgi:hypothetical protein